MFLYRYEFDSGCEKPHTGILTGLDDLFETDQILKLCAIFEDELPAPVIWDRNTLSFFTEKGNRKFNKAIRKIKEAAKEIGVGVNCIKINYTDASIIYEDKYQVITPNPYNAALHILRTDKDLF